MKKMIFKKWGKILIETDYEAFIGDDRLDILEETAEGLRKELRDALPAPEKHALNLAYLLVKKYPEKKDKTIKVKTVYGVRIINKELDYVPFIMSEAFFADEPDKKITKSMRGAVRVFRNKCLATQLKYAALLREERTMIEVFDWLLEKFTKEK